MKKILIVLLLAFSISEMLAKDLELDYPYKKQIEKGQFDKIHSKLQKQLAKEPKKCDLNFLRTNFVVNIRFTNESFMFAIKIKGKPSFASDDYNKYSIGSSQSS